MKLSALSDLKLNSKTYSYFLAVSVISTALVPAQRLNIEELPVLLSLGLFASVISIFNSLITGLALTKLSEVSPPFKMAKFPSQVLIIGVTRAFVISFGLELFEINNAQSLRGILTNSIVSSAFWLTLIAIIQREYDGFQEKYRSFVKEALISELHLQNESQSASPDSADELEKAERILRETLDEVSIEFIDREKLVNAAFRVKQVINDAIRPTSYRLWENSDSILPRANFLYLIKSTIRNPNPGFGFAAIMTGLLTLVNITTNFGIVRGGFTAAVVSSAILFYGKTVRWITKRSLLKNSWLNIALMLISGIVASSVLYLFNWVLYPDDSRLLIFLYAVAIPVVIFTESLFRTLRFDRESIFRHLSSKHEATGIAPLKVSRTSRDLANFFHNSLQSELFALSSRLESAASSYDSKEIMAALEQFQSTLNRSLSNEFADFLSKPLSRLERSVKAWSGIMKIEMDIETVLGISSRVDSLIVQVVEEAMANAYRHSGASEMIVGGTRDSNGDVLLEIFSNGRLNPARSKGLGEAWLSQYAVKWSRDKSDEGVRLSIVIPRSPY